jgi:hypothetical protein
MFNNFGSFAFDRFDATRLLAATAAPPPPSTTGVNPLTAAPPLVGKTIFAGDRDTMPFFDQGSTSGCGTTSLAEIETYLGKPTTQAEIDHEVRRTDIFGSPHHLVDHARARGLEAEMYNHGTWDELKSYVDRGIPTQALISDDATGDFSTLHYVAVVGYGTDPRTGEEFVLVHDPNRGDDPATPAVEGEVRRMSRTEFEKAWSKPPAGFENFFIAYGKEGTDLPRSRTDGIEGTLATAEGVVELLNGIDRVTHPDSVGGVFRGVLEIEGGLVGTVGGGLFDAFELSGDWAHRQLDGIPVVSNVLNPVVDIWTGVGEVGSDVVHMTTAVVSDLGEFAEKLGNGDVIGAAEEVGDVVVDVAEGAVNAVVDTAETVVNVVKDIFSGW